MPRPVPCASAEVSRDPAARQRPRRRRARQTGPAFPEARRERRERSQPEPLPVSPMNRSSSGRAGSGSGEKRGGAAGADGRGIWCPLLRCRHDHPRALLHVRQDRGQQVGSLPGTAAGRVHRGGRPGRAWLEALLLPPDATGACGPDREAAELRAAGEVTPRDPPPAMPAPQ